MTHKDLVSCLSGLCVCFVLFMHLVCLVCVSCCLVCVSGLSCLCIWFVLFVCLVVLFVCLVCPVYASGLSCLRVLLSCLCVWFVLFMHLVCLVCVSGLSRLCIWLVLSVCLVVLFLCLVCIRVNLSASECSWTDHHHALCLSLPLLYLPQGSSQELLGVLLAQSSRCLFIPCSRRIAIFHTLSGRESAVWVCVCVRVFVRACLYFYTYCSLQTLCVCVCVHAYIHVHVHVHAHVCVHVYMCVHLYPSVYIAPTFTTLSPYSLLLRHRLLPSIVIVLIPKHILKDYSSNAFGINGLWVMDGGTFYGRGRRSESTTGLPPHHTRFSTPTTSRWIPDQTYYSPSLRHLVPIPTQPSAKSLTVLYI